MKRIRLLLMVLAVLLCSAGVTYAQTKPIAIILDGKPIQTDTNPVIRSGRTLVPVAVIANNLGGQSNWDGKKKEVTITYGQTKVNLKIDSQNAYINGNLTKLDVPATIINSRTIVPLKFISEAMHYDVKYDGENKQVLISSPADSPAAAVQNIQAVSVMSAYSACRIEVKGAAAFTDYTTMSLTGPDRFVLDLKRAALSEQGAVPVADNAFVSAVRMSQFTTEDVRIVVDLKQSQAPVIGLSSDKTSLCLDFGDAGEIAALISRGDERPDAAVSPQGTADPAQAAAGTAASEPQDEFLFGSGGDPSQSSNASGGSLNNASDPNSSSTDNLYMAPFDGPMLVVLDPGHGGKDPGALGKENGQTVLNEKDVNLAVALRIRDKLQTAGISVYMTRDTDTAVILASRPAIANELNAALFVGIHNNASNSGSIRGTEVIYYNKPSDSRYGLGSSKEIAEVVGGHVINEMQRIGLPFNKYSERPGLAVMNKTSMPAILIEGAYLSNASDRAVMMSDAFVEAYASSVANGVFQVIMNRRQPL